jgi:putative FmdB family regulatory protein
MPLYDFECPECSHVFEVDKLIAERHEPCDCPECGGSAELLERSPDWYYTSERARRATGLSCLTGG